MNFYINGEIGYEVSLQNIQDRWNDDITDVYINSVGGEIFEGLAIYEFLKGKNINTHAIGLTASIASVIFMAGKKRFANKTTSNILIHKGSNLVMGKSDDFRIAADELDMLNEKIISIFSETTGIDKEVFSTEMDKDTFQDFDWLLENNFITDVEETKAVAKIDHKFNTNSKNNSEMGLTEQDKSWFENFLNKIFQKPKMKIVQDATGKEIDFPDLADSDTTKVGDKATIDGKPADGEVVMPNGETYVFVAGVLTEVKETVASPDTEAMQKEIDTLKQQLADAQAKAKADETAQSTAMASLRSEFEAKLKTTFNYDGRTEDKPKAQVKKPLI